jgi:hypothetical protein
MKLLGLVGFCGVGFVRQPHVLYLLHRLIYRVLVFQQRLMSFHYCNDCLKLLCLPTMLLLPKRLLPVPKQNVSKPTIYLLKMAAIMSMPKE